MADHIKLLCLIGAGGAGKDTFTDLYWLHCFRDEAIRQVSLSVFGQTYTDLLQAWTDEGVLSILKSARIDSRNGPIQTFRYSDLLNDVLFLSFPHMRGRSMELLTQLRDTPLVELGGHTWRDLQIAVGDFLTTMDLQVLNRSLVVNIQESIRSSRRKIIAINGVRRPHEIQMCRKLGATIVGIRLVNEDGSPADPTVDPTSFHERSIEEMLSQADLIVQNVRGKPTLYLQAIEDALQRAEAKPAHELLDNCSDYLDTIRTLDPKEKHHVAQA